MEVQKQQQVFHNLNERIKELKAIHKGVRVVQDSVKSFSEVYKTVVRLGERIFRPTRF
jgi:hypothetical protein